jgi:hypothetical protein
MVENLTRKVLKMSESAIDKSNSSLMMVGLCVLLVLVLVAFILGHKKSPESNMVSTVSVSVKETEMFSVEPIRSSVGMGEKPITTEVATVEFSPDPR